MQMSGHRYYIVIPVSCDAFVTVHLPSKMSSFKMLVRVLYIL